MAYQPDPIDREALRQGDVIASAQLVGAICYNDIGATKNAQGQATSFWTVGTRLDEGPVAILSHCCELSADNGVKLTSIIAAPVRDVSKATKPDKLAELIESNVLRPGLVRSYLKYYYLPPGPGLPFREGGVIDFSKLFSLRKTSYPILLDQKVLQLTDDARNSMATKLALYFYRQDNAA